MLWDHLTSHFSNNDEPVSSDDEPAITDESNRFSESDDDDDLYLPTLQ